MKIVTLRLPADRASLADVVRTTACLVQGPLLVLAGIGLLSSTTLPGNLAAILLLGSGCFAHFVVLHGCGHGSWANSWLLNTVIGHYASSFCLLPYVAWQDLHRDHHRTYRSTDEPIAEDARCSPVHFLGRWLRGDSDRIWVPLFALIRLVAVWQRAFELLFTSGASLSDRVHCLGSMLWPGAALAALGLTCPLPVFVGVLLPAWLFYLFLADSWVLSLRAHDIGNLF